MSRLTKQQAREVLQELLKRQRKKNIDFLAPSREAGFERQIRFVQDQSKMKAALTTRRAAKSYSCGLEFFEDIKKHPTSNYLYIALTRDSAKKIMWKDVLKVIDRKFGIGCKFNEAELTCTTPSGAVIYLLGMDSDEKQKEKALGQKYRKIVIDEAASFRQDLEDLVMFVLRPCLADEDGTISLVGTPGNNTKSFFYKVTTGQVQGWSVHKWNTFENPFMRRQWEEEIAFLKKNYPNIEQTPRYRQMYLGEWVIDTDALVYKFSYERNTYKKAPLTKYTYVLGVDLGYEDSSSFTVCAYSQHDKKLYIVRSFKEKHMIITDVANMIKKIEADYDISAVIVDGSDKQSVEEMRKRHNLSLKSAEKRDKIGFIRLFNDDLIMGRIQAHDELSKDLIEEWESLVWLDDDRDEEHPACDNHCADSALYAWRYCYNYLATAPGESKRYDSEEAIDEFWEREAARIESQKHRVAF